MGLEEDGFMDAVRLRSAGRMNCEIVKIAGVADVSTMHNRFMICNGI